MTVTILSLADYAKSNTMILPEGISIESPSTGTFPVGQVVGLLHSIGVPVHSVTTVAATHHVASKYRHLVV